MSEEYFKRYEKKYLLSTFQYHSLLKQLNGRMQADTYGNYSIRNIYFDTPDFTMIRSSLEKPLYKEKLRLRSYGIPGKDSPVYLEIKKKFDGIVYKRRTTFTLSEAEHYLCEHPPAGNNQVLKEIEWMFTRYPLYPSVFLSYDRTAFCGVCDKDLRITFDTHIEGRRDALSLTDTSEGTPILPEDSILMEVKIPGALPLWMSRLFAEMQLYPTSFSKYGAYYMQTLNQTMKGNPKYA